MKGQYFKKVEERVKRYSADMATVNLYAAARAAAGTSQIQLECNELGALISALEAQNQKLRSVLPLCSYLLNGTSVKELTTKLSPNDQVDVLPRFAGG